MKRFITILTLCIPLLSFAQEWEMVWSEEFNEPELNTKVWRKTNRGTPDWADTQSHDPRCLSIRDGCLILRGIINDDLQADSAHYLTGGVVTKDNIAFHGGRILVRARLHGAQGAWPAIWMLPYDHKTYHWPSGGEIDIMERLNSDDFVYQTVHSPYTQQNPKIPHGGTQAIHPDDFNVYGVDISADSISFHINGAKGYTYKKEPCLDEEDHQFPYHIPMYLLIDMQLGGSWVGKVKPKDLPVEMEIDYVRYYRKK